jgi:hypothetical protein
MLAGSGAGTHMGLPIRVTGTDSAFFSCVWPLAGLNYHC